jgi:hypothetical protein
MNDVSELQRRRAANQIWNAAESYAFVPDFKAFDRDGNAELYWNSIIGAVRRHYEYEKLAPLFASFQQYEESDEYEGLLWLGLENAVYQKELPRRPVLESLRRNYAKRYLEVYGGTPLDDYHLLDCMSTAHYQRALGLEPQMNRYDRKLLDELEFSPDLDTDAIVARARELFTRWFQITAEEKRRERRQHLLGIRRLGGKKGKTRFRKFGIGLADHPRNAYSADDELLRREDEPVTHLTAAQLRDFMAFKYGASMFPEQEIAELERKLCSGNHSLCHLHFTRGEPEKGKIQNAFEALRKEQEAKQVEKNRLYYREHLAENRTSIDRLASRIRNSVLLYLQPAEVRSDSGRLDGTRVWRAEILQDEKVFQRTEQGNMGDLSVDILLDASTSQCNRQERVSTQGFIIAQALTQCSIPCRVMSFCSMTGYTILRVFRDYDRPRDNEKIFEYVSNGCNRDGLAIRAVHGLMNGSTYENKILILLSDVKPHDALRIYSEENDGYTPYEKEAGVRDTAAEVRKARADGIAVICVFTGDEEDLPNAKLVYNKDFSRIPSIDKLADTVGTLLQNQIRNL